MKKTMFQHLMEILHLLFQLHKKMIMMIHKLEKNILKKIA